MNDTEPTDFGFQSVPRADKARRVRGVFDSVAGRYDLMNDLMSAGAHRLWKRFALQLTQLRPGQQALDVAGGTGDLSAGMARQVGSDGLVVLTDINAAMLARVETDSSMRDWWAMCAACRRMPRSCRLRPTASIASPSVSVCAM